MDRLVKSLLCTMAALLIAAPLACAQTPNEVSLGDAARAAQARKSRPSPNGKVYDNENLPKGGAISTTTGDYAGVSTSPSSTRSASSASATTSATTSTSATSAAKDKDGKDVSQEEADKAAADEMRGKVAEAKKNIAQLEREVDVMQRENRLKAAAYYGDAGTKLRDGAKYQAEDQKQQETLKAKQDELAAAKAALDQLRDDIRKAGLPSSIGE